MKLSRALKLKKKLAGEISHLEQLISTENMQLDSNKSRFNVSALVKELDDKTVKLVALKAQIATANSSIWASIFAITELKGRISFFRSLNTQEGSFTESSYRGDGVTKIFTPQLNKADIEELVKKLEVQIENLQDSIDDFNQSTQI